MTDNTPPASVKVPEGWALVLVKPTPDMLEASAIEWTGLCHGYPPEPGHYAFMRAIWSALLSAAPTASVVVPGEAARIADELDKLSSSHRPLLDAAARCLRAPASSDAFSDLLARCQRVLDDPLLVPDLWASHIAMIVGGSVTTDREARLAEALEPFVKHWERWMDDTDASDDGGYNHADDAYMSVFARVTYGDLRRARAALAGEMTNA